MALGHSPQIVTQGLVYYIDPSNTRSYAGYGNTIYNMVNSSVGGTFVGYTSNPIDNTFTRSLAYDGSANYIQTNYIPYFTSDFTIEVWANFSRYNDFQAVLSSMDNDNAINGFWFEFGSFRGFTIYSSGSQLVLEDNIVNLSSLELNRWHHIAVSRIGTGTNNIKLYVNNVLCGQNTYTAAIGHTSRNMLVGRYAYGGNLYSYFKGSLGLIKIYNRGLSATEILQNYNTTRKKYYPEERIVTDGLVLKLDAGNPNSYSGVGTVWNDLSGFGNTFYLFNGPTFSSVRGGAITFDGTNDYARSYSNSTILQSTTTFTVDLIFKYKNTDTNLRRLVGFADLDNSLDMWITSGTRRNCFDDDTGFVSFKTLENNDYTHLTYIVSPTEKRLYFNGILDRSAGGRVHVPSTNFISIASVPTGGYNCNMDVNLLQIYNRALTQQEVQQNYNATKNRFVNALPPVRNNLILELDATSVSSYPGTGTSWYDTSGFSNNANLINGPTFSSTGTSSSIAFDGTNDYVDMNYPSQINTGSPITLALWAKWITTGTTTATIQTLVDNNYQTAYIDGPGSIGFFIQDRPDLGGVLEWGAKPGIGITRCTSTFVVGDGKWHYITATNDGATSRLYVDGIQSGLARTAAGIGDSQPFINLGRWRFTQTRYLNGNIADFRIYNRALSAYEVKQNFDYYRTRYGI